VLGKELGDVEVGSLLCWVALKKIWRSNDEAFFGEVIDQPVLDQ
jgi:hypothetical protein